MKKNCFNCKFCGKESDHLKTDELKKAVKELDWYSCSNPAIDIFFRGTWVFGNITQEAVCGGREFTPKILQTSLF